MSCSYHYLNFLFFQFPCGKFRIGIQSERIWVISSHSVICCRTNSTNFLNLRLMQIDLEPMPLNSIYCGSIRINLNRSVLGLIQTEFSIRIIMIWNLFKLKIKFRSIQSRVNSDQFGLKTWFKFIQIEVLDWFLTDFHRTRYKTFSD